MTNDSSERISDLPKVLQQIRKIYNYISLINNKGITQIYSNFFLKGKQSHEMMLSITNHSVQLSSVAQSCPTLCDPMDCSTPGLPVHHHLPELTQTHVHWVGDAIQPSHPLLSPSSPAFTLFHHQGLFQRVSFLHQMAKVLAKASVLPMNIQDWFPLENFLYGTYHLTYHGSVSSFSPAETDSISAGFTAIPHS